MSSADYRLVNITDSSLEDISSTLTLPVIQGASSNTYQRFSQTGGINNNQLTFNIQVPSLSTCINRDILFEVDLTFQINMDTTARYSNANTVIYQYGKFNGCQSFPFNSAISTVKAQVNNTTLTLNTEQVKAALMKMMNYEDIAKWNGLSPSTPDSFYQSFVNGIYSNNNILGNFSYGSYDKAFQPRGVFPYVSLVGVAADGTRTDISATGTVTTVVDGGNNVSPYSYLELRLKVTEGLLFLSPFIYSSMSNNQADFLGINNMVIEFALNNGSRCLSNASIGATAGGNVPTITGVSLKSLNSADCLMQFKNIPPTMASKIDPKNCLNYYNFVFYPYTTGRGLLAGASVSNVSFSNVQLSQIPSKMLIYAGPVQSDLTSYDADFFFVISNLNITFANKAGLLSGASQQQLYNMSAKNLLQENYYEFTGKGVSATTLANGVLGGITSVPTIGSVIVIDPALDLSLDLEYSNNSTGQFNLTFQCTVQNQTGVNYNNFNLYLVTEKCIYT